MRKQTRRVTHALDNARAYNRTHNSAPVAVRLCLLPGGILGAE